MTLNELHIVFIKIHYLHLIRNNFGFLNVHLIKDNEYKWNIICLNVRESKSQSGTDLVKIKEIIDYYKVLYKYINLSTKGDCL